ncbi:hypothetical protein KAJ77_00005 [bacterium]|nr:hypothetical protein [bacterium]
MKKLSIILLALALALVFTVPAMAIHLGDDQSPEGSIGINGRYQMDGEAWDVDGAKSDWFDDDLDVGLVWVQGDVKALVGLEVADTNPFEGSGHVSAGVTNIVDNYYVEWSMVDNLKLKIGEYGLAFGRNIATDGAGARQLQLTYSLDALDITGALIKNDDLGTAGDDDDDELYIKLSGKQNGPFTKLELASYSQMNAITGTENSYIGVDLALPIGPLDLAFEYGANGGDLDGDFMLLLLTLNLADIDFGLNYFISSDDYSPYDGNDWAPAMILGDQVNGSVADMSTIWVTASFDVNDKLTLKGGAVVDAENDAGTAYGTEVDVALTYQFADNISYKLAYGSYSEGDIGGVDDVDRTEAFHRIQFTW